MGTYLIVNASSRQEAASWLATQRAIEPGESWTTVLEGIVYEDKDATDAECAERYSGFVPVAAREGLPLPPEFVVHAEHIASFGRLTQGQIDAAFVPGSPTNRLAHALRDVCRALVVFVDRRLDPDDTVPE